MSLLFRFNLFIEKYMPLVTPTCLIIGVVFSPFFVHMHILVPWLFAILTFSGSLNSGFSDMKAVLLQPLSLLTTLFLLHVLTPLVAWGAGSLFFSNNPHFVTGIILEFSVPTAVVSLIWVSINRGNSALSLSVILIDTLLSPFLTPLTLKLLVGSTVTINSLGMIRDLLLMIGIPALLAMSINHLTNGRVKATLSPKLAPFSKLCLILVVIINSSKVAPFFMHLTPTLIAVSFTILILAASGYFWGFLTARIFHRNKQDTISLTFGSGMRNISAGAVIAAQYFPAETLFPVMITTAFQQMLAALSGWLLKQYTKNKKSSI